MPRLIPYGNKVLVRRLHAPGVSAGGIYIPESAQKKSCEAVVLELGDGKNEKGEVYTFMCQVGDIVVIPTKFTPQELEWEGETVLSIAEHEILGKVTR